MDLTNRISPTRWLIIALFLMLTALTLTGCGLVAGGEEGDSTSPPASPTVEDSASGTLIIDHGHKLSSSFLHLHKILVKEGDRVKQGDRIAEVGATGRVTGPHLHWGMNWFSTRLDPSLLVPPMPDLAGKRK